MGVLSMTMTTLRRGDVVAADVDVAPVAWGARASGEATPLPTHAQSLSLADGAFDKVLAAEVLEHVDDDVAALVELRRVLRPGGVLAVSVPHANYPFAWDPLGATRDLLGLEPRRTGAIPSHWSNHVRLYLPAELRDALEAAGFVVEVLEQQTSYTFPFNHLLVYGVGKPLIERDLLPSAVRRSADRFHGAEPSTGRLDPVRLGAGALRLADRRNDHPRGDESRFVGIVARAVKPPNG
jgi:SAM-dependent methyltransferase